MHAKSTRERRPHRAVKRADRRRSAGSAQDTKSSEVIELVYQLMKERGGVPRRDAGKGDHEREDLRMAEAP